MVLINTAVVSCRAVTAGAVYLEEKAKLVALSSPEATAGPSGTGTVFVSNSADPSQVRCRVEAYIVATRALATSASFLSACRCPY